MNAAQKGWATRRRKRVAELDAKLVKRRNQPGMAENVKHLEDEIARLKDAGV